MTRLDEHIAYVRGRLLVTHFLQMLCRAMIVWAAVFVAATLVRRLLWVHWPAPYFWVLTSILAAVGVAWVISLRRKPSAQRIAAMMDERLNLRERFSTAVYLADAKGPFASAMLADAQAAAEQNSPRGRFPVHKPKKLNWAIAAIVAAILFWFLFPQMDLLHRQARQQAMAVAQQKQQEAKQIIQAAAVKVEAQVKTFANDGQIQQAKRELQKELASPAKTPEQAKRDAAKAMQQVAQAVQQHSAAAQAQKDVMRQLTPPSGVSSVEKAHQALANGNFDQAGKQIQKTAGQAAKNTPAQNQAAAKQLQELSRQLKQASQNNQVQQSAQNQLQQMGFTPKQIQQMTGNPQPASKLREMISKYLPHLSPMQQAQAVRLAQRSSADQQARQRAQAMSKSAQQMAQSIQKPQPDSKMASAAQSMQQQMQQMQENQQSAQQQQSQASAAQSAADAAVQSLNQSAQKPGNSAGQPASSQGPPSASNSQPGSSGGNQPGHQHTPLTMQSPIAAPMFKIKIETPAPQNLESGKVLADIMVKGDLVKGHAREQLQNIAVANQRQSAEDADPESIDAATRQTVKEYFQSMQESN